MFEVTCAGPEEVVLRVLSPDVEDSFHMKSDTARRLAAELIVAAERAERLERDMRAPG